MTQRAAAEALGVSYVHLSNVERGKSEPSAGLLERFRTVFRADLHVLAWCFFGDDKQVPPRLRVHRRRLAREWRRVLATQTT
jgi:transcriptional regulator with XRE-family HTH domain